MCECVYVCAYVFACVYGNREAFLVLERDFSKLDNDSNGVIDYAELTNGVQVPLLMDYKTNYYYETTCRSN